MGETVDGKPEGKGSQTSLKQGLSYTGQFFQGKKHGHGLLVNA